jgi:FkbM family methyltransferase
MQGYIAPPLSLQALDRRVAHLENTVNLAASGHDRLWKWVVNAWRMSAVTYTRDRLTQAGRIARLPLEFRGQTGEDLFLHMLFDGAIDGTYLEVGAFDGYNLSVSYAFDAMGWNGILVEPVPPNFDLARERRPHAHIVNAALSHPGATPTATFLHVLDHYGTHGGALSHLEAGAKQAVVTPNAYKEVKYQVSVRTMDSLLESAPANITSKPLDFVSIDVEGHELDLLRGFSLDRWKPRVLVVEDNSSGAQRAVGDHIVASGYVAVFALEFNVFYIHKDETALLKRAAEVF